MKHEPFENWIFEGNRLPAEQQKQLKAHTESCQHCQQMDDAWQAVQRDIQNAPAVAPQPGFANRWQANLAARRELEHHRQARRWIITVSALGFLVFSALIIVFISTSSPSHVVLNTAQAVFSLAAGVDRIFQVISLWFGSSFSARPATLSLFGLGWAGFLAISLLVFTGRKIYAKGVQK